MIEGDPAFAGKRVWIAGAHGMLGQALHARYRRAGCVVVAKSRQELDLTNKEAVRRFVSGAGIDIAVIAAAKVGGLLAYSEQPATYCATNISIALNCITQAHAAGIGRLVYVASAAAYPIDATQPIKPVSLFDGKLDPFHRPYGLSKLVGIELCRHFRAEFKQRYISVMPANLYGPGGHHDVHTAHVIPALMRRFHAATSARDPEITVWGSGNAQRQFVHVDDCADAIFLAVERYDDELPLNVASNDELTIRELAHLMAEVTGYPGRISFDPSKPEGAARRAVDTEALTMLGWVPKIKLKDGLSRLYAEFKHL